MVKMNFLNKFFLLNQPSFWFCVSHKNSILNNYWSRKKIEDDKKDLKELSNKNLNEINFTGK
jgi:hypothetical protein